LPVHSRPTCALAASTLAVSSEAASALLTMVLTVGL
jgi:hypothetical protein